MKLYDFDGMFDEKLSAYISKNIGKYKESEWEDIIPQMYSKFGDTVIKPLGVTPNGYYRSLSSEDLVKSLCLHIKKGVPVSEFLCRAIEERPECVPMLLPLLKGEDGVKQYAVNILGGNVQAVPQYMEILTSDADEDFKNQCLDYIKEQADAVKDIAVSNYKKGVEKELMLEILARVTLKSDEVFDILLNEFRCSDDVQLFAGYLASYGDERALPYLLEKIDEEGISYPEFQELKYAIEALGGEYDKQRDFTGDEYYDLIHSSQNVSDVDIFSAFNSQEQPYEPSSESPSEEPSPADNEE
ncbi:MAG: hypothetical protein LUD27_08805 [Clostridia bacterium]|nr:hypothetical protein [Clostridia bacterium]